MEKNVVVSDGSLFAVKYGAMFLTEFAEHPVVHKQMHETEENGECHSNIISFQGLRMLTVYNSKKELAAQLNPITGFLDTSFIDKSFENYGECSLLATTVSSEGTHRYVLLSLSKDDRTGDGRQIKIEKMRPVGRNEERRFEKMFDGWLAQLDAKLIQAQPSQSL